MLAILFVTTTALSAAALLRVWVTTRDTNSTFTSVFNAKYTGPQYPVLLTVISIITVYCVSSVFRQVLYQLCAALLTT